MKYLKTIIILLSIVLFFQAASSQENLNNSYFLAPVNITMLLSGNFAEIRSDHFHSGIDIKTQGVIGHEIYAAAEGYISRVNISSGGFGNALYLAHPNGKTTVYGHLDRFRPDIASYVRKRQYANSKHSLNIYPGKDEWKVEKGELIAWSGNSGYSFGPHLHFEIRNSSDQHPENVLRYGFNIQDTLPPKFLSLWLYHYENQEEYTYIASKNVYKVVNNNGSFTIGSPQPITVNGRFGIGIEAYDYLNGVNNKCGLYTIDLYQDEHQVFSIRMDEFAFGESRYINSFIDYEAKQRDGKNIQRLFRDPNNRLSLYEKVVNSGLMEFTDTSLHSIKIIIHDAYMNRSELAFYVRYSPSVHSDQPEIEKIFRYNRSNSYSNEGISIDFPENAFYTDISFEYNKASGEGNYLSDIHSVHNPYTPVHLPYSITLASAPLHDSLKEKAAIIAINDEGEESYLGGEWDDDMLTAKPGYFGRFAISLDTVPPVITPLNTEFGKDMSQNSSVRFRVEDNLSGIRSYDGYIDNQWVLFEYNARDDEVIYVFDPERLKKGLKHELELYIIDNLDNLSYYYSEFYW